MRELDTVDGLLGRVTDREPLVGPGKSGALLERARIGGRGCVIKHLDPDRDWTLRAAGVPATAVLWRRGLLDALPACIHQPIIAVAQDESRPSVTVVLMEDVGEWLVPAVDDPVSPEQQARFLDHMAAMHAAFWDTGLDIDVVPPRDRYLELSPRTAAREAALGSDHPVPPLIARGWPLLEQVAPRAAAVVVPLVHEPDPLLAALDRTPSTFVHGNWKLDNLGTTPEGRTVVIDWEAPGRGAPLSDLAWYLAINCRRLPGTKEQAIETYRAALERHGVDTSAWWERQLGLSLVGGMVLFGWEKALGGYDEELAWWEEHVVRASGLLLQ